MKHDYYLSRIMASLVLLLFFVFSITANAANNNWIGNWKVNDKNEYAELSIISTDKSEIEFNYDQGLGMNGLVINGKVKVSGNNTAFFEYFENDNTSCRIQARFFQTKNSKKLTLSNCIFGKGKNAEVFVPKSQKLYYKAGFNCAKASTNVELKICDSKILAASDRSLGVTYKALRKTLSKVDKKRLRKTQRIWMKERNSRCNNKSNKDISYCLKQYYGQRLFALNVLKDYGIWHTGKLIYPVLIDVHNAKKLKKSNSNFDVFDKGLGLWLSGVMKHNLTDSGTYEIQNIEVSVDGYILSGPYTPNPNEGFDPQAFGNKIFIEFSDDNSTWVGIIDRFTNYIYIPKNKTISDASDKFKSLMKELKNPKIINAF